MRHHILRIAGGPQHSGPLQDRVVTMAIGDATKLSSVSDKRSVKQTIPITHRDEPSLPLFGCRGIDYRLYPSDAVRWKSTFLSVRTNGGDKADMIFAARMSAIGPKQTSLVAPHMSAFGGKADPKQRPLLISIGLCTSKCPA